MTLMIRLMLVVSLVTQLVWSIECCGVVVLRPDLVTQRELGCAPLGACAASAGCCEDDEMSCCDTSAVCESAEAGCETECGTPCDSGTPCQGMMCSPLEQKKPSAAAVIVDIVALLAHPMIPPAMVELTAKPQTEPITPMILKCNHTRQAWLEVWRN